MINKILDILTPKIFLIVRDVRNDNIYLLQTTRSEFQIMKDTMKYDAISGVWWQRKKPHLLISRPRYRTFEQLRKMK